MKTMSLRLLMSAITVFCAGLGAGVGLSNAWSVTFSFGAPHVPGPVMTYFYQSVDSNGKMIEVTNEPDWPQSPRIVPLPPDFPSDEPPTIPRI